MLEVFRYSMDAVFPILLLIVLGYAGRRAGMLSQDTVRQVNRFNFRFGYSSLLFINMYEADLSEGIPFKMISLVMIIVVIITLEGWIASGFLTKQRDRRGILIQASFRSNYAIIGVMLTRALAGEEGVGLVGFFQLPTVLYFNIVSVIAMSLYSHSGKKATVGSVMHSTAENPLIRGLLLGFLAVLIRPFIPLGADGLPVFTISGSLKFLYSAVKYLSQMASPLALIVLGANLRISDARNFRKELIGGVLMRLVTAPIIGFAIVYAAKSMGLVEVSPAIVAILIAILGSPLATASAIMAQEMEADHVLAGQLVVWTSFLSMISLFVIVSILRVMGWL